MSQRSEADRKLERYHDIRRVTLIGSVVDLALGVAKILVGLSAHSQALIADGVHSLSDLATDFMVIFAAKHAHREADEEHPYGHGRIETLMTIALAAALLLVAGGIVWDASHRLFHPELLLHPGPLALWVALVSVLSKEAIYHYTMRYARRLNSKLLSANAWHSRSDAISSIVVMIGVGGTMAGLPYLDAIAAAVVGLMIAKIAWNLGRESAQELIDTALEAREVERIRTTIKEVKGVRALHMLRTRMSGGDALVDVHIQVDPKLSVSEGHQIGERVRNRLIEDIDVVRDVTVHIDPEDDELKAPSGHLPLRHSLLQQLRARWEDLPEAAQIQDVTLHYLNGKVQVDLVLPLELAQNRAAAARLQEAFNARAREIDGVGEVRLLFR
ncbi:cation diffusion facilitator family transporter [Thiohalobacter sp. IOR34]|uniref:cation diffusion facilitator family transporter n=1 Tax=Thiohalobacter sp. IOR34 TaxID=3057176 RepID=UPI0025B1A794|nr:cation diffusion facilitator family transporter [Thiohalobacter sp. IOR34]WJW75522.1 cation diffusion facilitator family transporter [Thiohalobacter sp. IOR34]